MVIGCPNLDPHACVEISLPTEPSYWPRDLEIILLAIVAYVFIRKKIFCSVFVVVVALSSFNNRVIVAICSESGSFPFFSIW